MNWRLHGPPHGQLFGRRRQRAAFMTAGQNLKTLVDVVNGPLQDTREVLSFFDGEDILKRLTPILSGVGPPPAGQSASQRPHGEREPSKSKALVS